MSAGRRDPASLESQGAALPRYFPLMLHRLLRLLEPRCLAYWSLGIAGLLGSAAEIRKTDPVTPLPFHAWAARPPMGWNSWDCFATTVTEAQTKAQADFMAANLKRYGWEYIVVDIQWYEPAASSFDYRKDAVLTLDEFGRLLPAPNRFPSAANGSGFKVLADYVHGKGLKFGLHLMRGIPRQAVAANRPIKGSPHRAAEIADRQRVCPWNPDMFGVEMTKPGAQEYYDSVFALIASWGVDFVKVDDLSRPYRANQAEVEAVRTAIDRTGRPMVLSLSPGETALEAAEHVKRHANMWRISDDFWDSWPALSEQFARLQNWNPHRGPGYWPDADMLPLGTLDLGSRTTHFTADEQGTLMTLWSIARSPLMLGADLTKLDAATLALLTNEEVLAVNQNSAENRPLFDHDGLIAWVAKDPGSSDRYLAVFNARDRFPMRPERAAACTAVVNPRTPGHGFPVEADLTGATKLFLVVDDAGDGSSWDHGLWVEPRLIFADGTERRLTDLKWVAATAGWGQVSTTRAPGGGAMAVGGKPVAYGFGAHARSVMEFDLPPDVVRFKASGALDDATLGRTEGSTVRFMVYAFKAGDDPGPSGVKVPVALSELGGKGPVQIRDLWQRRDLGAFSGEFAPLLGWHGAGLYRLSAGSR